jgi:hypothetical protein
MIKLVILLTFLSGGCAHFVDPEVWEINGQTVLRYPTGSSRFGQRFYLKHYNKKAREVCKGPYELIEQGSEPKGLPKNTWSSEYWTWTIKCL